MITLILNDELISTEINQGEVTLDLIRRELGLKGTKEGCREGDCGACSVLLGELTESGMHYRSVASCLLPAGELHGKHLVTIEGLNGKTLSPIQQAIVDEGATQCGFCTPGIIISLTGFMLNSPALSTEDALASIEGNICRCTGYTAISRAVEKLTANIPANNILQNCNIDRPQPNCSVGRPLPKERASASPSPSPTSRIKDLVNSNILPNFFLDIAERLSAIPLPNAANRGDSVIIGGGTDIYVQKADKMVNENLRFISHSSESPAVTAVGDRIIINAAATTEDLMNSSVFVDIFPAWQKSFRLISSQMIRGRATVGGNIVNASPIGDISIMLLALNASLIIKSSDTRREVALDKFYKGYKQLDLQKNEQITRIIIPHPALKEKFNFEKVAKRQHLDIASVNSAILIEESNGRIITARISAGGIGPIPTFLTKASAALAGSPLTSATIKAVAAVGANEVTPISDVRGSAAYKKALLKRLITAHFIELFPDLDLREELV